MAKRTDLAMEARQLWQEQADSTTELPGVKARQSNVRGIGITTVEILDAEGAKALDKPVGSYVSLQWDRHLLRDPDGFARLAQALGKQLRRMVPRQGTVLVAGLGNSAVTPDAVGPKTLEHLVVTRHLGEYFPQLRTVCAIAPGVLGTTGLESVEIVRGTVERSGCACVVVVDALASASLCHVCNSIQLTDTGITPGSGVGNSRMAFDAASLGVPVVAVGVPTVVDAASLLQQYSHENCQKYGETETNCYKNMMVTPRDIDAGVCRLSRLLGYGISLGLHRTLTVSDVSCLIG